MKKENNTTSSFKEEVVEMIKKSTASNTQREKLVQLYVENNFNKLLPCFINAFPEFDSYRFCEEFAKKHQLLQNSNSDVVKETINAIMHMAEAMLVHTQKK